MNVLVAGGTGFVGRRLVQELAERGDRVTVLSRNVGRARAMLPGSVTCAEWESGPRRAGSQGLDALAQADAVVNLAGEPVAQRWTPTAKWRIETSRIDSTRNLVDAIGEAEAKPKVFVCASAIGYYGTRPPSEALDEGAGPGVGFLTNVVERWEHAARRVEDYGVRSVQVRIGVVLGEGGGALEKMIVPFRFFAGGPIGDGTQVISWIHRDDVVGLIRLALDDETLRGPMNAVAPTPVTAAELAEAIGVVLGRPSRLRVPALMVKLALGEAAELVVGGQRVVPAQALRHGYVFRFSNILPALEGILGAPRTSRSA